MSKRYYELKIFGDDFERLDRGIYPSIADMPDEYNTEYLWITRKGIPVALEEWPKNLFFRLTQDVVRDTCLYNLSHWLLFSNELCDAIKNSGLTGFQFLPIKVYDMKGKIISDYKEVANVDNKADCMDLKNSVYKTCRDFFEKEIEGVSGEKIISARRLILKKGKLPETNVFKLENMTKVITDEVFVELFTSHNYSGLSFKEVEVL